MKVDHLPSTLGLASAELEWLLPTEQPAPSAKRRSSTARPTLKHRPGHRLKWEALELVLPTAPNGVRSLQFPANTPRSLLWLSQ